MADADAALPHTMDFSSQSSVRHAEEPDRQDPFFMWCADQEDNPNEGDTDVLNLGMARTSEIRSETDIFSNTFASLRNTTLSFALFCGAYHVQFGPGDFSMTMSKFLKAIDFAWDY